jgi:hypothetical protein
MSHPASAESIAMNRFFKWKNHYYALSDEHAFAWFKMNSSEENWRLFYSNFLPNVAKELFNQREMVREAFIKMPNLRDKKYLIREDGTMDERGNRWSELLDIDQWKKDLDIWQKEMDKILNKEI